MTTLPKSITIAVCVAAIAFIILAIMHVLTWTTFLTLVALVVSILSLCFQIWRTGLVQSADLLLRFEHDFFGPEKVKQRSLAAANHLRDPEDFREMEDILDFFETVAMLTHKRALDLYMVWHTFDYWIEQYYAVARPHIHARQQKEPGVWEDLTKLVPKLQRLHAKERTQAPDTHPDALQRFLAEEAAES